MHVVNKRRKRSEFSVTPTYDHANRKVCVSPHSESSGTLMYDDCDRPVSDRKQASGRDCPACLKQQVKMWLDAGSSCTRCGHTDFGKVVKPAPKAKWQKRTDRRMCAENAPRLAGDPKLVKSAKEGAGRFLLTLALARQQNAELDINENLRLTAAPGQAYPKGDFTLLRGNNKPEDIKTGTFSIKQLAHASMTAQNELEDLVTRLGGLVQTGASPVQMASLVARLRHVRVYLESVRRHIGEPVIMMDLLPTNPLAYRARTE
jgi:hypothetical protein